PGRDSMVFNGSDAAEAFDVSANDHRVRLTRDVEGVVMDLNGVEEIDLNPSGGADSITVNDQSTTGTSLTQLNVNLSGAIGGTVGDNEPDAVILNGSDRGENLQIGSELEVTTVDVAGLFPFVTIRGSDGPRDVLAVNTLGGNDMVDASGVFATNAFNV